MSFGQSPFDTNYSANTARLINVSGDVYDEDEPITFVRSVGNGRTLYATALNSFTFNPFSDLMKVENILSETIELTDFNVFPTNMKMYCANGQVFFQPQPTIMPYDTGSVSIGGLGTITISGGSSYLLIGDRSTGDIFQLFSSAGVFTLKSNFTQNNFEITTSGSASLYGTAAGLRFYERLASPTNYYQFFTSASGSVFTLTYNGTSIATIGTTGITTLVPQKIQNTLQTTGTQFLTMMPLSATTTAGQVVGTHASLTYAPATGTLSATIFSGSLTGSASLVDNTLQTTGTQFLTMVPLSATTPAGQVVGTHAGLTYNVATGGLTATTFFGNLSGTTGSVSGTFTATTFNGSLSGPASLIATTEQTTGTFPVALLTIATTYPGGQVVNVSSGLTYNAGTSSLISTNFTGLASSASTITTSTAGAGTFYPVFTTAGTGGTSRVLSVDTGLSYVASTDTLTVANITGTASTSSTITTSTAGAGTFYPVFTTAGTGGTSRVLSVDTGLSYVASTDTLTVSNLTGTTSKVNITTKADDVEYSIPFVSGITGSQFLYGDGGTPQITYNPFQARLTGQSLNTTYITINQGNIIIYDQTDGTKYWTVSSSGGNLYFNNTTSPLAIPLILNYDGQGVIAMNAKAQAYDRTGTSMELDSPCLTENNFGEGVVYVGLSSADLSSYGVKTSPTSTSSGALITMTVQACNPARKKVEVSFPLNFYNNFTRTSGTFAIDVNMTVLTVSMTRNGVNFTGFAYVRPTLPLTYRYTMTAGTTFSSIQQPACQLDIYFNPTDTAVGTIPTDDEYIIKIVPTFTTTTITGAGTRTGLNGGAGFDIDIGTVRSTAPTNFTFNTADPTGITALAITKSGDVNQSVVRGYYLTSEYHNLVYQRTFTSEVGVVEPLCFGGGYTHYDITWMFSSSPTAYTALSFALATSTGTVLTTGYSGRTALLGDTYSYVSWTTTAFVAYMYNRNWMTYKMTISHPNTARAKVITGTNNGSANGTTFLDCPHIMSGQNTTTTAYNSMYWSVVGTAVNGNITITGRNT